MEAKKNQSTTTETRWKREEKQETERHWNFGKPSNSLLPITLSELQSFKITSFHSFILNVYKYSTPRFSFLNFHFKLNHLPLFSYSLSCTVFWFQQWLRIWLRHFSRGKIWLPMTQKLQWQSAVLKVKLFVFFFLLLLGFFYKGKKVMGVYGFYLLCFDDTTM